MQIQSKSVSQSMLLKIRNYVIRFPSGYQFILKIPQQITVRQISQIMRSYTALHNAHGLKQNGNLLKPMYLSSVDGNLLVDLYLTDISMGEKSLLPLPTTQFHIEYSNYQNKDVQIDKKCSVTKLYNFIGQIGSQNDKKEQLNSYIVRNRSNCKLYTLTTINKNQLSYIKFQNIVQMRNYYINTNKDHNNQFAAIKSCFQTQKLLCIVSNLYPFELSRLKIDSKYLMDSILSQIARIVHILSRDNYQIKDMQLEDFRMDFKFQIYYCGIHQFIKKDTNSSQFYQQIKQQGQQRIEQRLRNEYSQKLGYLLQQLFKNCAVKLIQTYIPIFHWLKNSRINNYLQFLKYFQVMPNVDLQDQHYNYIKEEIVCKLFENYIPSPVLKLSQSNLKQFSQAYQPKTLIFKYDQITKQVKVPVQKVQKQNKSKLNIQQIFQQISTVKKKKKQIGISCKPFDIGKSLKKAKQHKKNKKGKSFILKNANFLENNNIKRHRRIISQFLIDD